MPSIATASRQDHARNGLSARSGIAQLKNRQSTRGLWRRQPGRFVGRSAAQREWNVGGGRWYRRVRPSRLRRYVPSDVGPRAPVGCRCCVAADAAPWWGTQPRPHDGGGGGPSENRDESAGPPPGTAPPAVSGPRSGTTNRLDEARRRFGLAAPRADPPCRVTPSTPFVRSAASVPPSGPRTTVLYVFFRGHRAAKNSFRYRCRFATRV
jgi:hypothetical protein